jgi:hypothetical protein
MDDDPGSEYSAAQAAADMANGKEKLQGEVYNESIDNRDPLAETMEPRKRGGQWGKRKLKDMYLALDGSALLTLGTSTSVSSIDEILINRCLDTRTDRQSITTGGVCPRFLA